jgi:hypothetical protein
VKIRKVLTPKGVTFLVLFAALSLIGMNINFSKIIGAENQFFTLFQFFGPIAGGFLGPTVGAASVLLAQAADIFLAGKPISLLNLLRITPMLFAAYYFGSRKRSFGIVVPLIAIALFLLHPVGKQVWFFSLFWTVPLIAKTLPSKYATSIVARSLGATFTAHAVGGVLWTYTVPMTPETYMALIPVVIMERTLFAAGIAASYVAVNAILDKALETFDMAAPAGLLYIEKRFTFRATRA